MNLCRIKYIALLLFFFTTNAWAKIDINSDSILNQVYMNFSSISSLSFDLKITTKEAGNITSTYTATVFENWNKESYYSLYKLNNKQLLFTYNNKYGVERFWLGKLEDLPEIQARVIDTKILSTAITYSSLNINPFWLNIPVDAKTDQGFLVLYTYNKNIYSNFTKVEFYINKDNIPVRILYYNNISSFPVVEILVTDYKKEANGFIILKLEYKDNASKRVTTVEKNNIKINPKEPPGFEEAKKLINSNINNYYDSFMLGIRNKKDVLATQEANNKNITSNKETKKENIFVPNNNNSISDKNSTDDVLNSSKIRPTVIPFKNSSKSSNESLLKALEGLDNKKSPTKETKKINKHQSKTNVKQPSKKINKNNNLTTSKKASVDSQIKPKQMSKKNQTSNNSLNKKSNNQLVNKKQPNSDSPKLRAKHKSENTNKSKKIKDEAKKNKVENEQQLKTKSKTQIKKDDIHKKPSDLDNKNLKQKKQELNKLKDTDTTPKIQEKKEIPQEEEKVPSKPTLNNLF